MKTYSYPVSSMQKGAIAIRRTFSLVGNDYKDRIFKLVRMFRNVYGSIGKYINFSIGVTSQQCFSFRFVKICVFRTHILFHFFTQDTISIKCQGNAAIIFKGLNTEIRW